MAHPSDKDSSVLGANALGPDADTLDADTLDAGTLDAGTFDVNTTKSQDETTHLRTLGTGKMPPIHGAPGLAYLESFRNTCPQRDYIVSISYPEFTSLCPVTGQPDLGTIVMEYVPDERCVESKSFKLYMFAYRNHQTFMETLTNDMLDHMWELLEPRWCRIKGLFVPRGGTCIRVFAERFKELAPERQSALRQIVQDWKQEAK